VSSLLPLPNTELTISSQPLNWTRLRSPSRILWQYAKFSPQRLFDRITAAQDCLELLLPLAAERMDLSYYIHPNVPACKRQKVSPSFPLTVPLQGIHSDYARIRQGNRDSVFVTFGS
jgi:hypothetical protein